MKRNSMIENQTVVPLYAFEPAEAWNIAQDVVDYPVQIVNAYYKRNGEYHNANGETKSGRDKHFNLVLVDRLRTDDFQCIASVTGVYGTIATVDTYKALQAQLEISEQQHQLRYVYVSGNGGVQQLDLAVPDKCALVAGKKLTFSVRLTTSVDGTRNHTLSAMAFVDNVSYVLPNSDFNLAVRHTTTIEERTVDFIPTFGLMLKHWDEQIVPFFAMIADHVFDRDMAIDLLDEIAKSATIGERHRVKIRQLYESGELRVSKEPDSMFKVWSALNQYVDDTLADRRDTQDRFKDGISKAIIKQLKKQK